MKSFDEWWKTEGLNTFDYPKEAAESGFEAGQQSKQAEVDELQARVDEALDMLKGGKGKVLLDDIVDTLKGNKDD